MSEAKIPAAEPSHEPPADSAASEVSARPRRRWLQFRLRTLLLAITLLCVGLGWWIERGRSRHAAIVTLQDHYAGLDYANAQEVASPFGGEPIERDLPGPAFLRHSLGDFAFTRVESVRVKGSVFGWVRDEETMRALRRLPELRQLELLPMESLTDERLQLLAGLVNLESLDLSGTSITSAGLVHLADMQQLDTLKLNQTEIDGAGLAHLLVLKRLRVLELNDTHIDDADLAQLAQLPALEALWLANTNVTDAGLAQLMSQRQLKVLVVAGTLVEGSFLAEGNADALTEIDLRYTPVREEVLAGLARAPRLERVDLRGCWELPDGAVEELAGELPASVQLDWIPSSTIVEFHPRAGRRDPFGSPPVSPQRMLARLASLTNLEGLDLRGWDIVDADLSYLAGLANLEFLCLAETTITGEGLSHLQGLEGLKQLNLSHTNTNDAALAQLVHCRALEELVLTDTPITDAGLRRLDGLANLKGLFLAGTDVNGLAFAGLPCGDLEELDMRFTPLTDEGLGMLTPYTHLKWLTLTGCWNLSEEGMITVDQADWTPRRASVEVRDFQSMTTFYADDGHLELFLDEAYLVPTSRLLFALSHADQLKGIELFYGTLDVEEVQHLAAMRHLLYLNLGECDFTPAALRQFPVCPQVICLNLSGSNVDDSTIAALSRWRDLQELHLRGTHITPAGAEQLREALPDCAIEHSYHDPDDEPTQYAAQINYRPQ